jgi:hypothetical protein
MIVGIDVRDTAIIAVRINERGEVIGRETQEGSSAAVAASGWAPRCATRPIPPPPTSSPLPQARRA